jgi:protein-S-isoprenylcysteine O-methyltransferase Ste14
MAPHRGPQPDVVIEHPNREKASSKATKAIVIALLLVSVLLLLLVSIGGWEKTTGARSLQVGYVVLYLVFAFLIARWSRGVLPVASALAIILLIFAAVAAPGWYERDKPGFAATTLDPELIGLLCVVLVPVQLLLIAFAMRGFGQAWHVEVERPAGGRTGQAAIPA